MNRDPLNKINLSVPEENNIFSLTPGQKISMKEKDTSANFFSLPPPDYTVANNPGSFLDEKSSRKLKDNNQLSVPDFAENAHEPDLPPKPFTYLEENNELQTLFTFCVADSAEQIKVNLVFYKINTSCSLATYKGEYDDVEFLGVPFILFGGIDANSTFSLPYFTYDCVSAKTSDDVETNFRNECILNAIKIAGSPANSAPDAYKGFIMHNDEIFVVIDTNMLFSDDFMEENAVEEAMEDVLTSNVEGKPEMEDWLQGGGGGEDISGVVLKWALVDELLFERNVDKLKIDEAYLGFLEKHRFLWELEQDGHLLPFPYALYGVKHADETETKYDIELLADPEHQQIEHNVLGLWYLFLADSAGIENPAALTYKKYACFITKPKFYDELNDAEINLDADSTERPEKDEEQMNVGEELLTTSSIYFKHDDKTVWGVKYEEQFCEL